MTEDDIFATQYAYHNNLRSPVERHSLYERLWFDSRWWYIMHWLKITKKNN